MTAPLHNDPDAALPSDRKGPLSAVQAVDSVDALVLGSGIPDGGTFEEVMKERNRIRKEREEYHVAELKVQITRLEQALAAETKRRVDATTALDDLCRTQVLEMEERLQEQLEQDNKRIDDRLSQIESRLEQLEGRWQRESSIQIESIQSKADGFAQALQKFQSEQDTERKARLRREGRLLQQVEDHAKEFEDRWFAERRERLETFEAMERQLEEQQLSREQEQSEYQSRVNTALTALEKEMAQEIAERKAEDEEIVGALNRYTQQLQQSLSILSSD